MVTLTADQRSLLQNSKYSFLTNNYSSGVSSFYILNASDTSFAADAFLLLGNFGSEDAEVVRISTVDSSTGLITLTTTTKRAHSESSKVSVLPYNQVRFYYTTTATFSTSTPLTGYVELQAGDWFCVYNDETYSTGYGWFTFYNSVTAIASQPSNNIPYAGFGSNTTEDILNSVFSLLGNKELKLITREEVLDFVSEGYSKMRNKLNLSNSEYTASGPITLSITSGTVEYLLESDFDDLISITSGLDTSNPGAGGNYTKKPIEWISLKDAYNYTGDDVRYYLRGKYIGFLPTPTESASYIYRYTKKGSRLSSNTDEVDLPNNGEYIVQDFALYRCYLKFQNINMAGTYLKSFNDGLNDIIIASVKRSAELPSFGIDGYANV